MSAAVAEQELFAACQLIFGPELVVSREFLEYLQPAGMKSAYRKRAFETHPDTAAAQRCSTADIDAGLFMAVQEAYERLNWYLNEREKGFRFPLPSALHHGEGVRRPAAKRGFHNTAGERPGEKHTAGRPDPTVISPGKIYCGPLPSRRLLFGHFLYYAGHVPFRAIIDALVWQRNQRPRVGELACKSGLLSRSDVLQILKSREGLQLFGKTALSLGRLDEKQLGKLLQQQKILQPRFGEFFVKQSMMSREQLRMLLLKFYGHNAAFRQAGVREAS